MLGLSFIFFACFLWATDTLIRFPLLTAGISPLEIVFYEHVILVALFLPLVFPSLGLSSDSSDDDVKMSSSTIFSFMFVGIFGSGLSTFAFTKAMTLIGPSLAILLQKLQPIVVIVLARTLLGEKIKLSFFILGTLSLVGSFLIGWNDFVAAYQNSGEEFFKRPLMGYIYAFIAIFGWGGATVFGKKLSSQGYREDQIMAGRFFWGFLAITPFFMAGPKVMTITWQSFGQIFGMVIISGLLGMYLYYHGLKRLKAQLCALAEMFFPLCAVLINWLILGVKLGPIQIIGAVLLLVCPTLIEWEIERGQSDGE